MFFNGQKKLKRKLPNFRSESSVKLITAIKGLLESLAFSFSFNNEFVPVYSPFHTQLDLHVWFNHTLRNRIGLHESKISNQWGTTS